MIAAAYAVNIINRRLVIACFHDNNTINAKYAIRAQQRDLSTQADAVIISIRGDEQGVNEYLSKNKTLDQAIVLHLIDQIKVGVDEEVLAAMEEVVFCGDVNLAKDYSLAPVFSSTLIQDSFINKQVYLVLQSGDLNVVKAARNKLGEHNHDDFMKPIKQNIWIYPKGVKTLVGLNRSISSGSNNTIHSNIFTGSIGSESMSPSTELSSIRSSVSADPMLSQTSTLAWEVSGDEFNTGVDQFSHTPENRVLAGSKLRPDRSLTMSVNRYSFLSPAIGELSPGAAAILAEAMKRSESLIPKTNSLPSDSSGDKKEQPSEKFQP